MKKGEPMEKYQNNLRYAIVKDLNDGVTIVLKTLVHLELALIMVERSKANQTYYATTLE